MRIFLKCISKWFSQLSLQLQLGNNKQFPVLDSSELIAVDLLKIVITRDEELRYSIVAHCEIENPLVELGSNYFNCIPSM